MQDTDASPTLPLRNVAMCQLTSTALLHCCLLNVTILHHKWLELLAWLSANDVHDYLRRGNCLPCTTMAESAESTKFLVMGQPVARTTPSRAVTFMHTCNLKGKNQPLSCCNCICVACNPQNCLARQTASNSLNVLSEATATGNHCHSLRATLSQLTSYMLEQCAVKFTLLQAVQ